MEQTLLRDNGYLVSPAYSGTEALLLLEKSQFNLILLDLMLPGLSGKDVLQHITKREFDTLEL